MTDQTRAQQVETPTLKSISSMSAPERRQIWWKSVVGIPSRHGRWKLSKSLGDVLRGFNRLLLSTAEQAASSWRFCLLKVSSHSGFAHPVQNQRHSFFFRSLSVLWLNLKHTAQIFSSLRPSFVFEHFRCFAPSTPGALQPDEPFTLQWLDGCESNTGKKKTR